MNLERVIGGRCGRPFPVYDGLVPDLLAAHQGDRADRDATVVHVLATAKHRNASRYSMKEHGPHHYIAALRPSGRVTEFGDQG